MPSSKRDSVGSAASWLRLRTSLFGRREGKRASSTTERPGSVHRWTSTMRFFFGVCTAHTGGKKSW